MSKIKIVTLCGTSATGKSTIHDGFNNHVISLGYDVVKLVEPGGPLECFAREYHDRGDADPLMETAVHAVARFMLYQESVFPRQDEERLVFSSARGMVDSVVYQGIMGEVGVETVLRMNPHVPKSVIYLCLVVDGEIGHQRALKRQEESGKPTSRNETPERIDELASAYRRLRDHEYFGGRFHLIDTSNMNQDRTLEECVGLVNGVLQK